MASASARVSSSHTPEERGREREMASASSNKLACILLKNTISLDLEWYTFDVSDDPEHDKPAPSQFVRPCYPFLPPSASYHDDQETVVEFKPPTATAHEYYQRGWAIFGGSDNKILYRIREQMRVKNVGNGFCCIDLLSSTTSTTMQQPMTQWKDLRPVPNKLAIDAYDEVAHILVLWGKVYFLGGSTKVALKETKKRQRKVKKLRSPWAMVYDPSLDVWESLPNPPHLPEGDLVDNIFSACFHTQNSPCIVMGLPLNGVIQFYDVDTKIWRQEEFICNIFSPRDLRGKPVAVGNSLLYWYALSKQCLVGYDVTTKNWFVGYVPMHDLSNYLFREEDRIDAPPSLAHLGGDMFCLLWNSRIVPLHVVRRTRLFRGSTHRIHCMKIRVTPPASLCPGDGGIIPLEPTIVSCQSYIVNGTKAFCDGLVV